MSPARRRPTGSRRQDVHRRIRGPCRLRPAEQGQEKYVELPYGEEVGFPEGRRHPLHVNVHLGEPGTRQGEAVIFVLGSTEAEEHCEGYVNP